jgi:AcrR family transcriptional regulator
MSGTVIAYTRRMGRWQPDAAGRLRKAALELFTEQGFDQTTVAQIAERAGLTERTFFRHFSDKREVLFGGSDVLLGELTAALAKTPAGAPPLDQIAAALDVAGEYFVDVEFPRQRQAVIGAHAELRERELIKLASWSAAFAATLRERGVREPAASLSAEAGVAVFKVAFERWIEQDGDRAFAHFLHEAMDELKAVTAG